MPRKKWKTEDNIQERKQLEKLYIKQNLFASEVAEILGWAERTVYNRLAFHGLKKGSRTPKYCECCGQIIKPKRSYRS